MQYRLGLIPTLSAVFGVLVATAFGQDSLTPAEWSQIRQAYEAEIHRVVKGKDEYRARNPGQRWTTRFDGSGFTTTPDVGQWSWGLQLASFGIAGDERAVDGPAQVEVDGARVTYVWGPLLKEWYVNDTRGLEHGYTVHARPDRGHDNDGPLSFSLTVRGGLHAEVLSDGLSARFLNDDDVATLTYAGLLVLDADGELCPAFLEAQASGLRLIVSDEGARYPLTIDPIAQQAYLKASNGFNNDRFGESVAISGDTVVVGTSWESSNATGVNGDQSDNSASLSGAAYVFVRSGSSWSQQAYLKASNTETFDGFGNSVSVSGNTIVIGAWTEDSSASGVNGNQGDNSANNVGAAYVFVRTGTTWNQQAYLKASNPSSLDFFGNSVSVSGDTIVVGASREDGTVTNSNSGAAYVFARSGTTWSQQAYLQASNPGTNDQFGYSVAISADSIIVGSPWENSSATDVNGQPDESGPNSGAAYVFVRNGAIWSQQAFLKASNTGDNDNFGWSTAISGETVIVGAPAEDSVAIGVNKDGNNNSAVDSGAAYVFDRVGSSWNPQAYLKASNTAADDRFGLSVAISNDRVIVGAPQEDSNAVGVNGDQTDNSANVAGAAYAFVRNGATWSQQAYLKASDTDPNDEFGKAVAISGDTALIGAIGDSSAATGVNGDPTDSSAPYSGAAFVFTIPCGTIATYGSGCAGSGGFVPTLTATGCPTGNGTVTITIAGGLGGAPVILLVGNTQTSLPVGAGCNLLVPPLLPIVGLVLPGSGAGNGTISFSSGLGSTTPSVTATVQAAIGDAGNPIGFSLTQGLLLDVQ